MLAADVAGTAITANYDSASGTLTLSGNDSVANYQQVLRTVTYDNGSDTPDATDRIVAFVADDGILLSAAATTRVTIAPTNDAPGGGRRGLRAYRGRRVLRERGRRRARQRQRSRGHWPDRHAGGGPDQRGRVHPEPRTASFDYVPAADFDGVDTFTYVASDGAASSSITAVSLVVTPVNDAPATGGGATVAVGQGQTGTLAQRHLAATDVDDTANQLRYTVTTAPTNGHLAIAGAPNVAIAQFTQADVDRGRLLYVHDGSANAVDTFTLTLADAAGLPAGSSITLTVSVTLVEAVEPTEPAGPTEPVEPEPTTNPPTPPGTTTDAEPEPEETGAGDPPEAFLHLSVESTFTWQPEIPEGSELAPGASFDLELFHGDDERGDDNVLVGQAAQSSRLAQLLLGRDLRLEEVLDQLRFEVELDANDHLAAITASVARAESLVLALSGGLLAILLRSGALWAVALSSLPLWQRLDPVAILGLTDERRRRREEEIRLSELLEDETSHVGRVLDDEEEDEDAER